MTDKIEGCSLKCRLGGAALLVIHFCFQFESNTEFENIFGKSTKEKNCLHWYLILKEGPSYQWAFSVPVACKLLLFADSNSSLAWCLKKSPKIQTSNNKTSLKTLHLNCRRIAVAQLNVVKVQLCLKWKELTQPFIFYFIFFYC